MPSWWKLIGHVQYVSVTVASVTRLFQACADHQLPTEFESGGTAAELGWLAMVARTGLKRRLSDFFGVQHG